VSALSFESVSANYSQRAALRDVTAKFAAGAVTAVVGPNGAGKTTLFRVALGILSTSAGAVQALGKPIADCSREAMARTIAYLPQSADAHWPVTARRIVSLGRLPYRKTLAPMSRDDEAAVENALSRCEANEFAERPIDELSAGERTRVLLARALATQAPILLADEPAAHLDPAHQLLLMRLLKEEAARGTAVAVTLHDLTLASRYCDEIVVMQSGRVAAQGTPASALSDANLADVFGVAAVRMESGALVAWRPL
jgi:iron complex transport system ATP-binding protein